VNPAYDTITDMLLVDLDLFVCYAKDLNIYQNQV
jgi:hypothetical protein